MEKAERLWGAKEELLWGYSGKNFNPAFSGIQWNEGRLGGF